MLSGLHECFPMPVDRHNNDAQHALLFFLLVFNNCEVNFFFVSTFPLVHHHAALVTYSTRIEVGEIRYEHMLESIYLDIVHSKSPLD